MSTIIFIVCYMGKLPWYVHHFLHSCNYNLTIDFLLVTDDRITPLKIPNNVTVTYKDLSKINELGTKKLNLPISIKNGYKLCDFKPAYGKIFEEDIAKYDYWGYGDLDVIFGDIRAFITDHVLQSHDIISVRHDFLTGYFQLLKIMNLHVLYTKRVEIIKRFLLTINTIALMKQISRTNNLQMAF